MVQLHKKFTDIQVKELIDRYLRKEIERKYIQEVPSFSFQRALKEKRKEVFIPRV